MILHKNIAAGLKLVSLPFFRKLRH